MSVQTSAVDYTSEGANFEGYFAWNDSAAKPFPCVLISHAWAGPNELEFSRARDLAELGYGAFCLDLYGKGIRGSNPEENAALMQPFLEDRAMLQQRLKASLAVASQQPGVDSSRMVAIGYCFGGLCVLDMARTAADVLGVVSFHGLFQPPGNTDGNKISSKVLALHGWDDPLVRPEMVVDLATELTDAGADWQIHGYGHTLHAFTNPEANDPNNGAMYSAIGDRRSWKAMVDFLEEVF